MNTKNSEILEDLFGEHSDAVLRVHFVDNEVYELTKFYVFQENDGEYEECWADVVRSVRMPQLKMKSFENVGMSFQLRDVLKVEDVVSGRSLFATINTS